MSMNTRDERLYHYEYRRPRPYNPTYNSNNVFDSLNMFVRADLPSLRTQGRYSLPKPQQLYLNRSELHNYPQRPAIKNYSTISTELQRSRQADYYSHDRQGSLRGDGRNTGGEVRGRGAQEGPRSRAGQNPESRGANLKYHLPDSLQREVHQFQPRM